MNLKRGGVSPRDVLLNLEEHHTDLIVTAHLLGDVAGKDLQQHVTDAYGWVIDLLDEMETE